VENSVFFSSFLFHKVDMNLMNSGIFWCNNQLKPWELQDITSVYCCLTTIDTKILM
jgi:hypothetical protein